MKIEMRISFFFLTTLVIFIHFDGKFPLIAQFLTEIVVEMMHLRVHKVY